MDRLGFFLNICSPDHPETISPAWESWSGGESQRIRLSGTMALGNLILNSRGITSNIEILDEPCSHLDEQGIENIIELLATRAKETKKAIWLTDHRSLTSGSFDAIITVVKTADGSHIEEN